MGLMGKGITRGGGRRQQDEGWKRSRLEALALTAARPFDERRHDRRVGELSAMLARAIGLPQEDARLIHQGAPLHDLGLIAVPERILAKPGPLKDVEFEFVKRHTDIGSKMLSYGDTPLLRIARQITLTHHERFDGSGYPRALKGDAIPVAGQIVALADFFDSLTRPRPHRQAWSVEEAVKKIRRRSGTKFNPRLVTAFLRALREQQRPRTSLPHLRLRGTLDLATLYDLLASLSHNRQSSRLGLRIGLTEATLIFQDGRLRHAQYEDVVGDVAVLKLLDDAQRYPGMSFTLEPIKEQALSSLPSTIHTPTQELLLQAAVASDHQALTHTS